LNVKKGMCWCLSIIQ